MPPRTVGISGLATRPNVVSERTWQSPYTKTRLPQVKIISSHAYVLLDTDLYRQLHVRALGTSNIGQYTVMSLL